MRRICFEITDVLWHARRRNSRVTGIQRVQLNLIRHLASKHGGEVIRCVFFDWHKKSTLEFNPNDLFDAGEYDGECLLRKLGLLNNWRCLPGKLHVSEYLSKCKHSRVLRAWKKLQVYVWALLFPGQFKIAGLKRTRDLYPNLRRIPVKKIDGLPVTDSLVFLGGGLPLARVIEFGRRHWAAGGDVVQMIHDLIPCLYPEYCTVRAAQDFSRWLTITSQSVSRFICVSASTARDLQCVGGLPVKSRTISVIPLAHEFEGYARNAKLPEKLLPGVLAVASHGFVLCVGTIEVRKNGAALLRSWLQLHQELGDQLPILVFAGKRGWLTEAFDLLMAERMVLKDVVVIVESPSDETLAALYSHCLFTVFPSFYEGWGLPIGEAAWFGKCCVASHAASMPEVCGNLVDYVDPYDQSSILAALRRVITDAEYCRSRESVIKSTALRTWRQVADELFDCVVQYGDDPRVSKNGIDVVD